MPEDRATAIKKELEELLTLDANEEGTETLKDEGRKTKKIQYRRRTDGDSKESNDDARSKQSGRSKQSRRSRASRAAAASTRVTKKPTGESDKNEDIQQSPKRISNSPKPERKSRGNRKIQYRSDEPETAEERDRDARSHRSKESRASRSLRRSGHRNPNLENNDPVSRSTATSRRRRARSNDSNEGSGALPSRSNRSTSRKDKEKQKSWSSFDDFDSNEWSSSDEDEVDLKSGDEGEFALNDESPREERRSRPRRSSKSNSVERRRGSQGNMSRSSSAGGLEGSRGSSRRGLQGNVTRSSSSGGLEGARGSSRRQIRRGSNGAIDTGMVLGDPSRRAPPRRTKSNEFNASVDLNASTRNQGFGDSNDFSDYLRKQGLTHISDRSTARTEPSSLDSNDRDEDGNPFEVTFQQSFSASDNWDPFASGDTDGEKVRSGGLLQTSSKDTISRLRAGAPVRKGSNIDKGAIPVVSEEELGEREKQRRSDYKKSIIAAAMAGRQLSSSGQKPVHRQVRTVRSSFKETVKQLEGALQSVQ